MPKKNAKAQKTNELDGAEFFAAINLIEKEKGIPKAYMLEKITQALVTAYKRDHEGAGDNVTVEADEEKGTVRMFVKKDVVEEVDNPCTEMSLEMARDKLPQAQLGDVIRIEVRTRDFGRIAAQTARQVIIQGMREAERGMIYDEFSSKEHELLTGVITRIDPRSGGVSLRIGSGNEATEAFLAPGEQVKGEEGPRCSSPAPTPAWSSACSSWRCPRSTTAPWRSSPSPGRRAAAPSWPSGLPIPTWTPSAPAWAPGASG